MAGRHGVCEGGSRAEGGTEVYYNFLVDLYNPAMGILLLVVLLASAAMLMLAFAFSFRGDVRLARRLVKLCGAGVGVYGAVWLAVAILPRTSVMQTALPYCDDDLCMTVLNRTRTASNGIVRERFDVRLSSRANRGTRSARAVTVYLTDDHGVRFPLVEASPVPFEADVEPHRSLDTSLSFDVPPGARKLYFEARTHGLTHGSSIIGSGGLWPPLLKLAID